MTEQTEKKDLNTQSLTTGGSRKRPSARGRIFYFDMFALELARGGAHIASALTPESRTSAMLEVIADCMCKHGSEDLGVFLGMLVARLEARTAFAAAEIVRDYAEKQSAQPKSQSRSAQATGVCSEI